MLGEVTVQSPKGIILPPMETVWTVTSKAGKNTGAFDELCFRTLLFSLRVYWVSIHWCVVWRRESRQERPSPRARWHERSSMQHPLERSPIIHTIRGGICVCTGGYRSGIGYGFAPTWTFGRLEPLSLKYFSEDSGIIVLDPDRKLNTVIVMRRLGCGYEPTRSPFPRELALTHLT